MGSICLNGMVFLETLVCYFGLQVGCFVVYSFCFVFVVLWILFTLAVCCFICLVIGWWLYSLWRLLVRLVAILLLGCFPGFVRDCVFTFGLCCWAFWRICYFVDCLCLLGCLV